MNPNNHLVLKGHVGADPKIEVLAGGRIKASYSLCERRMRRSQRERWHQIVAWDQGAKVAQAIVRKGRFFEIHGQVETQEWEDPKTGQRKSKTIVIADIQMALDKRSGDGEAEDNAPAGAPPENDEDPFS